MDVPAVSLAHFTRTADGRMVEVPDDVLGVACDLKAIDPVLRLRFSETGGYFVVYQETVRNGRPEQHLVLTSYACDQRIVERVREIRHPSYDYAAELEQVARDSSKAKREQIRDAVRSEADRLAHALRQETRAPRTRIYVP